MAKEKQVYKCGKRLRPESVKAAKSTAKSKEEAENKAEKGKGK